jgi:hypothetical protein
MEYFKHLPLDVLKHHIFELLPAASLVMAAMTCRWWRDVSRLLPRLSSDQVLLSMYRDGVSLEIFQLFEQHLSFPTFGEQQVLAYILEAAKGIQVFFFSATLLFDCDVVRLGGHLHIIQHVHATSIIQNSRRCESIMICSLAAQEGTSHEETKRPC